MLTHQPILLAVVQYVLQTLCLKLARRLAVVQYVLETLCLTLAL